MFHFWGTIEILSYKSCEQFTARGATLDKPSIFQSRNNCKAREITTGDLISMLTFLNCGIWNSWSSNDGWSPCIDGIELSGRKPRMPLRTYDVQRRAVLRKDGGGRDGYGPGEGEMGAQKAPSPAKGHKQVTELKNPHPDLAKAPATRRATVRRKGSWWHGYEELRSYLKTYRFLILLRCHEGTEEKTTFARATEISLPRCWLARPAEERCSAL